MRNKKIVLLACLAYTTCAHSSWSSMVSSAMNTFSRNKAAIVLGTASAISAATAIAHSFKAYKKMSVQEPKDPFSLQTVDYLWSQCAGRAHVMISCATALLSTALACATFSVAHRG